jgi:hypothetical protein
MRLRPYEKSARCLQNFERKKLPENSFFLNDDPYIFFHTTYSLNRFKKNCTSDIKTTYGVVTDIGSRIIHTPSCEKKITEKRFLSIFKMVLNAEKVFGVTRFYGS